MAVHAHPDDESIGTGGILARYAAEGVRVVLVTCTDGGCGDGADGSKPGEPGHDVAAVVAERRLELERSCQVLGVTHLETLDYADSGMMGWPQNDEPHAFWNTPVADAAERLVELLRKYEPQVVVTYNEEGFYGHPDHIQAHRITVAADRLTAIPSKLYYTAVSRSDMAQFGKRLEELGISFDPPDDMPSEEVGPRVEWGTPDEEITTRIDVGEFAPQKYESLQCHASQSENIFFLKMGLDAFREMMGNESFVRAVDRTGAPVPEDDLFAGLR